MAETGPPRRRRKSSPRFARPNPDRRAPAPPPAEAPEGATHDRLGILETALQQIAEGVIVADRTGRFLFWNEAARKIVGMGPEGIPPADWSSVYGCFRPDEVTPYLGEELPLVRALRGEEVREEEVFVRNPGNPQGARIVVSSRPLRDEKGEVTGGVVVFRDVTAHRRSHEVVRQLTNAVERTTDAVFITDVKAVIQYVNPAFETITGYTREQALGRRPSLLKSGWHDQAHYEHLWKSILAGQVHRGIVVNRRRSGELFHAEQTITPVGDDDGHITHFVSVMRDVTERKKAQEREAEMRLARVVQQKLFPEGAPAVTGFDLAGAAFPADHTCGDYFDFLPTADGRLGIAVGDVSGHGFSAALLMAETRAYLRSLAEATTELSEILGRLNLLLCRDTEEGRFVTLILAFLDPARRSLVYSSAGHIQGYVLDRSGATRHVLESTGIPLGLLRGSAFATAQEIVLEEGDLLLLLTDGVAEAQDRDGTFFGPERVLRVVAEAREERAARIVSRLRAAVEEFSREGSPRDDITVVVGKVVPCPSAETVSPSS